MKHSQFLIFTIIWSCFIMPQFSDATQSIQKQTTIDNLIPATTTACDLVPVEIWWSQYKLGQPYDANEVCGWIFQNPASGRRLIIELEETGFADTNDHLEVYVVTTSGQIYLKKILQVTGDSISEMLVVAMIVVFKSDGSGQGTGFRLKHWYGSTAPGPGYGGEHVAYSGSSGYFEHSSNFNGFYTWVLNHLEESTVINFHFANFNDPSTRFPSIHIYGWSINATFSRLAEYDGALVPWSMTVETRDPVFIFFSQTRFDGSAISPIGLQVDWNLGTPPFTTTTITPNQTETTGGNGGGGGGGIIMLDSKTFMLAYVVLAFSRTFLS